MTSTDSTQPGAQPDAQQKIDLESITRSAELGDPASLERLAELAGAGDRIASKAARTALFTIKQRGIAVPQAARTRSDHIPQMVYSQAVASTPNASGQSTIILLGETNIGSRAAIVRCVINEGGMLGDVERTDCSGPKQRELVGVLLASQEVRCMVIPLEFARSTLRSALAKRRESGASDTAVHEGLAQFVNAVSGTYVAETMESIRGSLGEVPHGLQADNVLEILGKSYYLSWHTSIGPVDDVEREFYQTASAAAQGKTEQQIEQEREVLLKQATDKLVDSSLALRLRNRFEWCCELLFQGGELAEARAALVAADAIDPIQPASESATLVALCTRAIYTRMMELAELEPV